MVSKQSEKFNVGDLVSAKVRCYPLWPARIEGLPDPNSKKQLYDVTFYGTNEPGRCKAEKLLLYAGNQDKVDKSNKTVYYKDGMKALKKEFMEKLQLADDFCEVTEPDITDEKNKQKKTVKPQRKTAEKNKQKETVKTQAEPVPSTSGASKIKKKRTTENIDVTLQDSTNKIFVQKVSTRGRIVQPKKKYKLL